MFILNKVHLFNTACRRWLLQAQIEHTVQQPFMRQHAACKDQLITRRGDSDNQIK
jgi:hypothetical protein